MTNTPYEFSFEIDGNEYTVILTDADQGGLLASLRLPSGKVMMLTDPVAVFRSTAEAVNAARLYAAGLDS